MTACINSQERPWQNDHIFSNQRLKVLFRNGYFSDLIISFPGTDIKYKAHKVVLAMSSSVFESMLFGPMAITGSELKLPDDDPEAFKIILARCYDLFLDPTDIDVALEVYMLTDKYYMEHFGNYCAHNIEKLLTNENVDKVLKFASSYNFNSLKKICLEYLISSNASIFLQKKWFEKLHELKIKIPKLVFGDSWKNPVKTLSETAIIQLLKSEECTNSGLEIFSGCVSAKVVKNICWNNDNDPCEDKYNQLYLSLTSSKQANEIINILDDVDTAAWIYLHLPCKKIPAGRLARITRRPEQYQENEVELFISNVDDSGIDWVVSAVSSLKPVGGTFEAISLPRSSLTFEGLKTLMSKLGRVIGEAVFPHINVCSSKISSDKNREIENWVTYFEEQIDSDTNVKIFDTDEDIDGWHGPMEERGPREDRIRDEGYSDDEDMY